MMNNISGHVGEIGREGGYVERKITDEMEEGREGRREGGREGGKENTCRRQL